MTYMKKTFVLVLLALLGMTQLVAQENYEYVPFVREGVKWVYWYKNDFTYSVLNMPSSLNYWTFEMKGDTVIAGKHYKPVHLNYMDYNKEEAEQDFIPVYLREEDKVVYAIHPDGKRHSQCPVGIGEYVSDRYNQRKAPDGEYIIYDFNDPMELYDSVFDQIDPEWEWQTKRVTYECTDTIALGGHHVKRHQYKTIYSYINGGKDHIIEGVGYDGYNGMPLFYFEYLITGFQVRYGLSHVIEDGQIVYKSESYTDDMYMPLDRESVQWVNEKVTVNGDDTTRCYYTYENKGNYPGHPYKACYYHEGKGVLDGSCGTLVAGSDDLFGAIYSYRNTVLDKVIEEDRNMMNYGPKDLDTKFIYSGLMDHIPHSVVLESLPSFFIGSQRETLLTSENFIQIDPVMIENCMCSRWAYLGEQGDTLAYVVEGIGFDSYDLGDLLTPFTKKPDPDADYQEWCGLSHVVKDGKIIYKGMRYREGTFDGINEVTADTSRRPVDPQYYNLMGQPVGKDVPTVPGIYIHQGKKICVSRTP